jgi:GrpB-like predicted nucleotidyltransferase (UPF0157 family)/GNAT superfamily N-acetyltransferase
VPQEEPIVIVDPDPAWPDRFESERRLLIDVLQPWLAGPIEHVGSTAIPGLRAKPIIDIMAGVESLESARAAILRLQTLHYHYFPYRPEVMHWFCKPSPAARTHHLHLVPIGTDLWVDRLDFRDHLRSDREAAAEYAALKDHLAARHRTDREAYTDAKSWFVRRILLTARRGRGSMRVLACDFSRCDTTELLASGAAEGYKFVERLHREWLSGQHRFAGPHDAFVGAFDGPRLIGICGLHVDPFLGDPSVGRVEHLYVLPAYRRRGIGTWLLTEIVAKASAHFARVRLRTRQAPSFYEKLGFQKAEEPDATHTLAL